MRLIKTENGKHNGELGSDKLSQITSFKDNSLCLRLSSNYLSRKHNSELGSGIYTVVDYKSQR